jgi:hypothetical protein
MHEPIYVCMNVCIQKIPKSRRLKTMNKSRTAKIPRA